MSLSVSLVRWLSGSSTWGICGGSCPLIRSRYSSLFEEWQNSWVLFIHSSESLLRVLQVKLSPGLLFPLPLVLLHGRLAVVELDFLIYELFILRDLQTKKFEVEIIVTDWRSTRLILFEVKSFQVGMSQGLLNRDSLIRIKDEHFL